MNFKSKYLIIPLLISLGACSDNALEDSNQLPGEKGEVEYSYLSVNLVPTDAGTRADFAVGSESENKVNSIRFYFFDENLKAVKVKANGATFYDVTSDGLQNTANPDEEPNIESTVNAVIVIESPKGDDYEKPYYMAAVINPNENVPALSEGEDISLLQTDEKAIKDYGTTQNGFIMSSTVYKGRQNIYDESIEDKTKPDSQESEIVAQLVHHKIYPTRQEALQYPATIYVERVMGKVTSELALATVDGETAVVKDLIDEQGKAYKIYKLSSAQIDTDLTTDDKSQQIEDIYVRFLGWNVTATRNTSRLIKKIDITSNWADVFKGWNSVWNDVDNHRSYWAINPETKNLQTDYTFYDFQSAYEKDFEEGNAAYLQENAGKAAGGLEPDAMYSKIIVGAQLVDSEGKPLTLVKWRGNIYNCGDDKSAAKVLDALASDTRICIYDATETPSKWRTITGDDV